jgi:hypothetical protein
MNDRTAVRRVAGAAGSRHQRPIYMVGDQTAKFIASQGFFMPQGECGAGAGFRERPASAAGDRERAVLPPLAVIASRIVSGVARREEEIQ